MTQVFAAASGYVDPAIEALQTQQVYVDPGVSGAKELQAKLEQEVSGQDIAVVVLPKVAEVEGTSTEILRKLTDANNGHHGTVIVAVGDDLSAASGVLGKGEAMGIANEAESVGSLEGALTQTVEGVVAATPAGSTGGGGLDGGLVLGLAIAAAVVVAGITVPLGILRSRRKKRAVTAATGVFPEQIKADIAALRSFVPVYVAAGNAGGGVAQRTARSIDVLATNTGELFTRLARRPDDGQISLAGVEYDDKLRKLSAALHPEYLLDIVRNPHLWDDPKERISEVERALDAVSDELLQNIKQVNASRALQFQVSLDGLVGGRKELQDWDRDFKAASGDDA